MDDKQLELILARLASARRPDKRVVIAIDGPSGAGKTTLSWQMADRLLGSVVQVDDFYRSSSERARADRTETGWEFDLSRLRQQVLVPLEAGRPGRYQRYDWPTDRLAEWHEVEPGTAIIEGVYSLRSDLRSYYGFCIWVSCSPTTRLARMLDREDAWPIEQLEHWMQEEDQYMESQRPDRAASIVVDGEGVSPKQRA
jgi:uridine kinase